jgi:hypothetical protein
MVSVLGPLFRTSGHTVRTQHGVTASAGQRRGDVEIRNCLRDQAGSRSLVFDLSITHDLFGSSSHVQQNSLLSHPQDLDAPSRLAAERKMNSCRQQCADNQNISFLPAILSTSTRESSKTPNPPSSPTPLFPPLLPESSGRAGARVFKTQLFRPRQYQT